MLLRNAMDILSTMKLKHNCFNLPTIWKKIAKKSILTFSQIKKMHMFNAEETS